VVRDASDAVTVHDLDGHTLAWNPGATHMYGWTEAEALQLNVRDRLPPDRQKEELAKLQLLVRGESLPSYSSVRLTKDGTSLPVEVTATALIDAAGKIYAIATTECAAKGAL
jgi:two-component system CheB/CheR fusion protein